MTDSYVQVNPNSTGAKVDTVTLDNSNQRQTVTIGDSANNAQVATVVTQGANGYLLTQQTENPISINGSVNATNGAWIANTAYTSGQVVNSLGSLFTCNSSGTSGNLPINGSIGNNAIVDNTTTIE